MRYKQLVVNDIEKADQLCLSLINGMSTNVINREKALDLLNKLKYFIEQAKEKVDLESD
jgi:hypothetical protein